MKQIALVPIDNRPVCYQLPKQIAALTGDYNLLLPDRKLLGNLNKNADISGIIQWLDGIEDIDVVVLSADTIAYGGLIPSRRSSDSIDTVKKRINSLVEILRKKQAKIYAFSSIMRISNNNINEEEKEYWNLYGTKIFQYSYNMHKKEKDKNNGETLSEYKTDSQIPDYILEDYLLTRKRNFEINKYYIELKQKGFFDTLVFSKDDCAEYGLNVKEAEELRQLSKDTEGIYIKTGADEIPLALMSMAMNKQNKIKIAPLYLKPESINKISKYEDLNVKDSVSSQIELCGGIVSDTDNCDLVLLVNNFITEQGELVMNIQEPLFEGELVLPDKPYFIADILNANGSDNNFVKKLLSKESLEEFYGYAAWNTTGNTLGSSIAAALTFFCSEHKNNEAFQKLQLTRFLDDWAYQANVRSKIRNNRKNLTESVLKNEMQIFERILYEKFSLNNIKTEYKFPWNRFFEIEINIKNI